MEKQRKRIKALTLTELLIAIGIIAVIAAFTLPTFIHNHQAKVNDARYENIVAKMTQAVGMMKANGDLDQFDTTMDFVNVLKKYLKINKICEADKIADCWGSTIVHTTDGKDFDVSEARTRANLGLVDDYGSNPNVGLVLSDGTHMILSYDPSYQGVGMGDAVVNDEETNVSNLMKGLSFVTDVNGSRGPNKERIGNVQHDVRGFNGATFSEACLDGFYEGNNCKAASECLGFIDGDKVCNEDKNACSGYIDSITKACVTNQEKIAQCAYIDGDKNCQTSCNGTLYANNTKCCETGNHISSDGTQCNASCSNMGELADISNSVTCVASCPSPQVAIGGQCQNCSGTLYANNSACCRTDLGSYVSSDGNSCVASCPDYTSGSTCVSTRPAYTGSQASCDGMKGTYISNTCYVYLEETSYSSVNCQATSTTDYTTYCNGRTNFSEDYWAGAKKACAQINMTLPEGAILQSYCNNSPGKDAFGPVSTTWSGTLSSSRSYGALGFNFNECYLDRAGSSRDRNAGAFCVK